MNENINIPKSKVKEALSFLSSTNQYDNAREVGKHIIGLLCGPMPKVYKPGDRVILSGPGINGCQPHLVCITGDTRSYRAVRFCSLITGRKAGESFNKPYQLPFEEEGITADQIEGYLDHQYTVVE